MTQSNPIQTTEKRPSDVQFQRKFWGVIAISVLAFVAYSYVLSNLFRLEPTTAVYIKMAVYVLAIVLSITSFILTVRRQVDMALTAIFYYLLILLVAGPATTQDRTLYSTFAMLMVGILMLGWLLPKPARRRNAAFLASAFVLAWVFEWINPPWRIITGAAIVGPIVAIIFTIILLALVAREAWGRSMRNNLLVAFIGLAVIATVGLGIPVTLETTRFLKENLERELTALAVNRGTRIGDLFNEQINQLTTLSLNEDLQEYIEEQNKSYVGDAAAIQAVLNERDAQWRAADAADNNRDYLVRANLTNNVADDMTAYQKAFPGNIEVFVTDVYGGMAGTTNRTTDYYQADEGWWQAAYANGEGAVYVGEPEYDESAGAVGVNIALPIRSRETGEIIGVLRTTYVLSALEIILADSIGETGSTDLFVPGENGVLHVHEGGLQESVPGLFEQLQEVYGQGMAELVYEGELSVVTQAPVQTLEGNPYIDNLGWVVAFHQHRDEAFEQVNGQIQGVIFVMLIVVVLAAAGAYVLAQFLVRPIIRLTATAEKVSAGELDSRAEVTTTDEIGTLATTFNSMTSQLQEILQGLEQRVAERTKDLELAAEVGRSVSQVREQKVMLKDACDLILEQFDLYYVQVYLTNPSHTRLTLEAGTGEVGEQLLERGHNLLLNVTSLNGRAAFEKRPVVIPDTSLNPDFRKNPLLPETRGEMAVPLIVGERVVGVLDMQTRYPGKLTEEVLPAFEALAGQLAVAIQNATLLAEAEQARAEVEAQARRQVRASWDEHLDAIHKPEQIGFVFDRNEVLSFNELETEPAQNEEQAVASPIYLSGEELGSLVVEIEDEERKEQTSELVTIVARQVAQQIENLRLLESAERYRHEAEEAARRQTIEGWQAYLASRTVDHLGYMYDLNEVRPHSNGQDDATALTLPLKARNEKVGKLSIHGLAPDDRESFELANAVAERLGSHIESLRLFEETRRGQVELDKRAQQLAAVAKVSTASSQELDVQKMLATVVHLTQRQFDLYHAHVFTYNEVSEELSIVACGYKEGDEHEGTHGTSTIPLSQEQSLVARAARTRQAVVVNDVHNEPGWLPNPLLPETRSELAVPLLIGDTLLGVLDVQSEYLNHFTEEDANIQLTLASQVAIALQNAYSYAQAQKQAERESLLNTINQKIQSATSVEAVLQIAARELGHALGAPMTIAQLSLKDQN